jgi:hypothetical protein
VSAKSSLVDVVESSAKPADRAKRWRCTDQRFINPGLVADDEAGAIAQCSDERVAIAPDANALVYVETGERTKRPVDAFGDENSSHLRLKLTP